MTNFFVFSAILVTLWSQAKTAGAVDVTVEINTNHRYQKFHGCGASWTDSAAWIMNGARSDPVKDPRPLEDYEKSEIFTSLFAKDGGIALDILRQPMGTSDFRWSDYTYQDDPDTPFSIGRDLSYIIPTIRQSKEHSYKDKIEVIALPWSAPAWAKQDNGFLTDDPDLLKKYHNYFVNFVQDYKDNGFDVWAVSVQNEPMHVANYPTTLTSAEQHGKLIVGVKEALEQAGFGDILVIGYDHNWNETKNTPYKSVEEWVTVALDTTAVAEEGTTAADKVDAIAFHCYETTDETIEQDMVVQDRLHKLYKSKGKEVEIFFTECSESKDIEGYNADFRWALRNLVIGTVRNWASTVLEWNMVLYDNGPIGEDLLEDGRTGCTNCRGLIDVNETGIRMNPAYYALGHLSKFVVPGAHRAKSDVKPGDYDFVRNLAMVNPDDSSFVILLNDEGRKATVILENWMGAKCTVLVEPWSAVTVFRDTDSTTMEVWETSDAKGAADPEKALEKRAEDVVCEPYSTSPTDVPSPSPSDVPSPSPSDVPSPSPSDVPSPSPSDVPSPSPSDVPSPSPSDVPTPNPSGGVLFPEIYVGCFRDSGDRDNRVMEAQQFIAAEEAHFSIKQCVDKCTDEGYMYAGLQYTGECFCGNVYNTYGEGDSCNSPCKHGGGYCGGGWQNSVYEAVQGAYVGCFVDYWDKRAMTERLDDGMSIKGCIDACAKAKEKYSHAGLQWGKECFCGNDGEYNYHGEDTNEPNNGCNMDCENGGGTCGGSGRNSVFRTDGNGIWTDI